MKKIGHTLDRALMCRGNPFFRLTTLLVILSAILTLAPSLAQPATTWAGSDPDMGSASIEWTPLSSPLGIPARTQEASDPGEAEKEAKTVDVAPNGPAPWTPDNMVFNNTEVQRFPAMATDLEQDVWVAFEDFNPTNQKFGVKFMESEDYGATWSARGGIYDPQFHYLCPDIAIDPWTNKVYIIYERENSETDHDILCSIHTQGGSTTYNVPVDTDSDDDRFPSITCEYQYSSNGLYASYERLSAYHDRDLMFARSTDHGAIWTLTNLEGATDTDVYCETDITNAQGMIYIAIRHSADYIPAAGESDIWVLMSSDRGVDWTVYYPVSNSAGPVTNPSIAATHGGSLGSSTVVVGYEYAAASDDMDVYYAYSTNSAATWSSTWLANSLLGESQPSLTVDGQGAQQTDVFGSIHFVYSKNKSLYCRSALYSAPASWSAPEQVNDGAYASAALPGIAITPQFRYASWYPCVAWTDIRIPDYNIYHSTRRTAPGVFTNNAIEVSNTAAMVNGDLANLGTTAGSVQVSFEWGLTTGYGNTTPPQTRTTTGTFSSPLTGLTPGNLYHFRARATSDQGTGYGADMTFIARAATLWPGVFSVTQKWHDYFCVVNDTPGVGDFNGDGKDDVVGFVRMGRPEPDRGDVWVALSTGSSFGSSVKWHSYFCVGDQIPGVGDVNGDGKDDLIAFDGPTGAGLVWVALSTGSGFGSAQQWHSGFNYDGQVPLVGDFNGDGKDDIATFIRDTATGSGFADVYVALSTGSGFGSRAKWHDYFCIGQEVPAAGDFNGDGKDDIAGFVRSSRTEPDMGDVWVAMSTGSGFGTSVLWHQWFCVGQQIPQIGDFNGDRKDDIVAFVRNTEGYSGLGDVYVALSTGSAFENGLKWHDDFATAGEWPDVGDFNGDGFRDIAAFVRDTRSGALYADVNVAVAVPPVATSAATGVGTSTATLNGNLTSLGTAASVQVSFEWGLTTAYGNATTAQTMTNPDTFSANIDVPTPGTSYHFRAKAVGYGTAWGADMTFTSGLTIMEGDVNGNGHVTITDAMMIAQYKAGMIALTADQLLSADTNDDGNVTMADAMHIAQWLVDPTGSLGVLQRPLWQSPADDAMLPPQP